MLEIACRVVYNGFDGGEKWGKVGNKNERSLSNYILLRVYIVSGRVRAQHR